ncbi:hypothetical protein BD779DRAFT_1608223 [Infundibulicybe gibba]|nr:hypothetical protein BD779DRAFT_1608223 [Infundibulicybe gibba]
MALNTSPRKVVPLAGGDDSRIRVNTTLSRVTKRVFFCGIVVEGSENGRRLPEDIQELVLSFGKTVASESSVDILSSTPDPSSTDSGTNGQRKRALTDASALSSVINELVTSERSYVKRLQILKHDYADPLRNFSRSKDTSILPPYEAKTLFGNVDNLLPVNEAFLTDLEKMLAPNGAKTVGSVGDVCLRHFKDLRGFEQYKQYYVKREEAQSIFEHEVSKRSSRFAAYIDHIKYQSTDPKNRIGLRELLMEPVQRIPRYTLLIRTMLKHVAPGDPQRAKLVEADEIASKIALAEADEQTKRAAVFSCLIASIEAFPPDLFSNSRKFIDCIDVEDVFTDTPLPSSASTSTSNAGSLHCTLFLFDDKLMIVKRPGNGEKGGRNLSGLDELDRMTKAGGIPNGKKKKSGMTCKGVVDVTDVVATDVGGADINLYLENPPMDQTDRWSGRPFRALSVVNPPMPINLDPTQTEADKRRFLENLWHVQATYRARAGQSVVLSADEQEVESKNGKTTYARTYYNVYQRTAFLQEPKKTKIVVHIDPLGSADPIPFGMGASPFARIRLQPMAGGLCRYSVTSSDPADEGEEDIVQSGRVPSRVVQTIHQFGLFEFRTGKDSRPSTPTARSRAAIFGLDAISRNLFNTRPGSSMGDFFGGSISGHRRTKSTTSRSSMYTNTTGDDSLMKFSHRSGSTVTAATTISNMDDESLFASQSSRSRKSSKRPKSPGTTSDIDRTSPIRTLARSLSFTRSRSTSRERNSDPEDDDVTVLEKAQNSDSSEWDLTAQLELARQNSMNQYIKPLPTPVDVDGTIYEEALPHPVRPESRASRETYRSITPQPRPDSPLSRHSMERRPMGPRCPSPIPPPKSPQLRPTTSLLPYLDDTPDEELITPPRPSAMPPRQGIPTAIPRSKRQPLFPTNNTDHTPKPTSSVPQTPGAVEPLSIKKKTSVRTTVGSPTPARKSYVRNSPLSRTSARIVSPRRVSPQIRNGRGATSAHLSKDDRIERMIQQVQSAKEDIESSRRTIKRIKLEVDDHRSTAPQGDEDDRSSIISRPSSPDKGVRTPQRTAAMNKAALDRMEEMRQLIARRQGEITPRSRPRSTPFTPLRGAMNGETDAARSVDMLVSEADQDLSQASSSQDMLQKDLRLLADDFKEKSSDLEKSRVELQNMKRQCELVKSLLADATAEKEIMYEAFNEELDGMYNDANLPEDEAWQAMSDDLRQTKESRNALSRENSQLKRRLAEVESQQEEYDSLYSGRRIRLTSFI